MLDKFKKYLDFSDPKNKYLENKIKGVKNVRDGIEILERAGWFITPDVAKAIINDVESAHKDAKILEKKAKRLTEIENQVVGDKLRIKQESDNMSGAKPSETLDPERKNQLKR